MYQPDLDRRRSHQRNQNLSNIYTHAFNYCTESLKLHRVCLRRFDTLNVARHGVHARDGLLLCSITSIDPADRRAHPHRNEHVFVSSQRHHSYGRYYFIHLSRQQRPNGSTKTIRHHSSDLAMPIPRSPDRQIDLR